MEERSGCTYGPVARYRVLSIAVVRCASVEVLDRLHRLKADIEKSCISKQRYSRQHRQTLARRGAHMGEDVDVGYLDRILLHMIVVVEEGFSAVLRGDLPRQQGRL